MHYIIWQVNGTNIVCRMDFNNKPYMTMFASCWGLLGAALLIAAPVIFFKIKEHTELEEDLKFSDEAAADVIGLDLAAQSQPEYQQRQGSTPEKKRSSSDA